MNVHQSLQRNVSRKVYILLTLGELLSLQGNAIHRELYVDGGRLTADETGQTSREMCRHHGGGTSTRAP